MASTRDEHDLAVVGGGPAGLATAIRARQRGLSVVLVDAEKPPVDRACGEGIMPDGVRCLSELGVTLPETESAPFRGIRWVDDRNVAEGRFPGAPGLGVRRVMLHRAMAERAAALGVELRWGLRATGVEEGVVHTADGPVCAHYIVGADGRSSRVRKWLGLDASPARRRRFGVRRHLVVAPWTEMVEVHWHPWAEAYVTPVGPRQVGVAILSEGAGADFDEYLELVPRLRERVYGAEPASRVRGAGPLEQRARAVVRGRAALVGDAAGYLDAITGEGLSLAFHQAAAVVDAAAVDDLGSYTVAHRRICRMPLLLTRLVLFMQRRPALRGRVLAALAADGELFDRLLAVHVGEASLRQLGAGSVLRLLRGVVRS